MRRKPIPIPENNAAKYFSHREAWGRIKGSIANGYYLEAVTLEESIISDRLQSYFCKIGAPEVASTKFISLGRLIELLCKHEQDPICDPIREPRFTNLQQALRNWKNERNHVVHGIVKSAGVKHDDVLDFFKEAKRIADEGEQIAKSVCNWYRRFKDKQKTAQKKMAAIGARSEAGAGLRITYAKGTTRRDTSGNKKEG